MTGGATDSRVAGRATDSSATGGVMLGGRHIETMPTGRATTSIATRGAVSSRSREELSMFISTSVLPQTNRVYDKDWESWEEFVRAEARGGDPMLTGMGEEDKAALVSLMMMRRHQAGKRGKAATSFTAAIRLRFARATCSTAFLDSAIIATARAACLMKPDELRAKKDRGPSDSVKLPVSEDILDDMRARLWIEGKNKWSDEEMKRKAAYIACMYGFEFASRVGEYTHSEQNHSDHCARVDDFTFTVEAAGATSKIATPGERAEIAEVGGFEGGPVIDIGV